MMIERPSEKLADGFQFTIGELIGFFWEAWDNDAKKFEVSPQPVPAAQANGLRYAKKWMVKTTTGTLKLSQSQIAECLERVLQKNGTASLNGKSFRVKTNGKTGIEVRYWFNLVRVEEQAKPDDGDQLDLSDIPF